MFSCTTAQHIYCTFTYKLYSMQQNSTYCNYTVAAATFSAAQQHSIITLQFLYKLYSLQMTCKYSNYTEAAATCSNTQKT